MFRNRRTFLSQVWMSALAGMAFLLPRKLLAFGRRRRPCPQDLGGTYGSFSAPTFPAPPDGSGNPRVAKVDTTHTYRICARGSYSPSTGFTLTGFRAWVYNDASQTDFTSIPTGAPSAPPGGGNYDFSDTNNNWITGSSCGMSGSESVAKIAVWAISTSGSQQQIDMMAYKFKGQCATTTDCG
jgi:hypothetical protein